MTPDERLRRIEEKIDRLSRSMETDTVLILAMMGWMFIMNWLSRILS